MTKVGVTQCQSNGGLFMTSHRAMYQVTGHGNSHRRLIEAWVSKALCSPVRGNDKG